MGEGNVQGSLEGSLLAPEVAASWQLPDASASGTASIAREVTKVTCKAPSFDISAALHVVPPDFEAVKNATTQAEISALAVPVCPPLTAFLAHSLPPKNRILEPTQQHLIFELAQHSQRKLSYSVCHASRQHFAVACICIRERILEEKA